MIYKLYKVRTICTVLYAGFFPIPHDNTILEYQVKLTGRWKIKIVDDGDPTLYLECHSRSHSGAWFRYSFDWISEHALELVEHPDPPKITEYINECARCE